MRLRPAARIAALAAGVLALGVCERTASAQAKRYTWSDIDCRQSRLTAWPGLTCRVTNVVTGDGNVGAFRQWAAFGTSRDGYYVHMFLWETQNAFSYLSADDTTAEFIAWIFENGKFITQPSPVARYRDADYVTFKDAKAGRMCLGFRRMGRPQRGGYDSLTGGILCGPPGANISEADISALIDNVHARPATR
jgi:hypothetical protein